MRKMWAVIRREFLTRVRSKTFVVATVLGPVLLAALMIVPALLASKGTSGRHIVVLDLGTEQLGQTVEATLHSAFPGSYSLEVLVPDEGIGTAAVDSLIASIDAPAESGRRPIDGLVVLDPAEIAEDRIAYYGSNVSNMTDMRSLRRGLREALVAKRLTEMGVDLALVQQASRPFSLSTERVTGGELTGESGESSFALAYVMAFLLYLALLLYGVQVMSAVIEEKSNRINEILVSSLRPFELLLGKVVGVGSAGLLQLGIWVGTAMLLTNFRAEIASLFGVSAETILQVPIPTVKPDLMVVFLLFFLLGFFLYSAAYAAVGAMCNSLQETQQASLPVTLTVVIGFFMVFNVLGDPSGSMAQLFSVIPLFAPLVVPVRYSLDPLPLPELGLSILATLVGVVIVVWIAGRIYRVGILVHGKRPKLKEILNWVKAG